LDLDRGELPASPLASAAPCNLAWRPQDLSTRWYRNRLGEKFGTVNTFRN
jgi:hypothetical protein